jgi:hypothetical protein
MALTRFGDESKRERTRRGWTTRYPAASRRLNPDENPLPCVELALPIAGATTSTFAKKMRSLTCTLVLAGFGLLAFFCFIAIGLPTLQMTTLIAISLLVATVLAFVQFRFIEHRSTSRLQAIAATALTIISFVACWQILWAASEEILILRTIATGQVGDGGARWMYPGMSGMGNADGFTRPGKMLHTLLMLGGTGATIFCFPFAWILTAFKRRSEQDETQQPPLAALSATSPVI